MRCERDYKTLKSISADIISLRAEIERSEIPATVEGRGFCLPEEDNWIKRLFATYKNHRVAVLEVIYRNEGAAKLPVEDAAESFLIGFSAATLLCRWSSLVVNTFKGMPIIKAKLNEGDQFFGIEPNLFDDVYRNLTRVRTQERLAEAALFFENHYDELKRSSTGDQHTWLLDQIESNIAYLTRSSLGILKNRMGRGFELFGRRSSQPFKELLYLAQSKVFDIFGNIWFEQKPDIPRDHQNHFLELAQPGDFFIVRPELKSSTVFLPGWWTHGAVYFGGAEGLTSIGAGSLSTIHKSWDAICSASDHGQPPVIIEALSAGVVLNPLQESMHVDQAVLLRPRFTADERLAGLHDVFAHYGKPYDFSFDFSRSDRLVCTEVIYRGYDGKGPIRFRPQVRLGNPTLSADDIMDQVTEENTEGTPSIDVVALSTRNMADRTSQFYEGTDALQCIAELKTSRR